MNHKPLDPLVHFVFIWYAGVKPGYASIPLTSSQIDKLRSLNGRDLIHYACELNNKLSVEDKVKHVDWFQSTLW